MPFPRCKLNLYDSGVRMPLAIRWPSKVPGGRVVDDFVHFADLAPTFLEAVGLSVPGDMTGRSLLGLLTSKQSGCVDPSRDHVVVGRERHMKHANPGGVYASRAIRTRRYLYVHNHFPELYPMGQPPHYTDADRGPTKYTLLLKPDDPLVRPSVQYALARRPAVELYDCEKDPDQIENVAEEPAYADVRQQLQKRLQAELKRTGDPRALGKKPTWASDPYYSGSQEAWVGIQKKLMAELQQRRAQEKKAALDTRKQRPRKPNVLFIATDDLRPMLGCYGDRFIQTPNIDRLAQRGTVFTRAYCQAAQCGPSRISIMTGLRPDSTGEYVMRYKRFDRKEHPGLITLPQQFKRHGYHAQSFGKVFHDGKDDPVSWSVPSSPGRDREMWEFVDEAAIAGVPFAERAKIPTVIKPRNGCNAIQAPEVPDETLFAGRMTDQAIETLGKLKDEPFFLAVGYRRPHLPFVAPKRYFDLYPPESIKLPANRQPPQGGPIIAFYNSWVYANPKAKEHWGLDVDLPAHPKTIDEALRFAGFELRSYQDIPSYGPIADGQQALIRQAYMACVSYVDAQIGRLLAGLERHGLTDDTIVVLWADHGWHLGEHGTWSKMTNYEWATRVPLIVAGPGKQYSSARCSALVELVDVYPTLCEMAGLELPGHLEGTSLAPLLRKGDRPWKRAAFSQFPFGRDIMGRALRTDRYRYVEWTKAGGATLAVELYDHQADPYETVNIAGREDMRGIVTRLRQELQAGWRAARPADIKQSQR